MTRLFCAIGLLLVTVAGCAEKAGPSVIVCAGDVHRHNAPVSVDVPWRTDGCTEPVEIVSDQGVQPAQLEWIEQGKVRVWWVIKDLQPNQERTYHIRGVETPARSMQWQESEGPDGRCIDLVGDKPLLRYVYPQYDKNNIEYTKKPFHHVYDPATGEFITKGVGGLFSHHRGIFFGYNKCKTDHGTFDIWHAPKGEHQQHVAFERAIEGPVMGGHIVRIDWNDYDGKPFATETRQVRAFPMDDHLVIDFRSTLTATAGPVSLGGDRQHAGVQFRASQKVAENPDHTLYLRPAAWAALPMDQTFNDPDFKGLPWNAIQYSLGDRDYTVAYLSDPSNPDDAEFSERPYGRFGEFFTHELTQDNPLTVHYRWYIRWTHGVGRGELEQVYQDFARPPTITVE